MQPQPIPQPRPQPLPAPGPPQRHRGRNLLILFGVLAAAGIVAYTQRGNLMPNTSGPGGIASVRTVPASSGSIERTLRLTGVTMAEKSASLIAPQMRGNRGGGGTVIVSGGRGGGGQMTVVMSSGAAEGGGGGSSSSSSSGASSSGSEQFRLSFLGFELRHFQFLPWRQ